ncbi:Secretin PulD (plasmid) [Providencia alcalifaciens]|nr:Secretin PulD [Providencia alcalifaciens]CAG9435772.1 Secretin PulD [Providencia alcalifaciens]CAG9435777.1 Secretin PulD [Providencia alcalifaciens]CAG9435911.1 Secretin PulD [Providencia alcalifaciens]CAG9437285.1 Secretin PulD [Providencia alcalifaciens]
MISTWLNKYLTVFVFATVLFFSPLGWGEEFSASFKGTDIQEFINTVSKNLKKTVIIDPDVQGTITVRSYDMLNEEQYYQFFLSVLDVYGFAVVDMNNGVLKVVRSKDAKMAAVPVASDAKPGSGDEVVTRVVSVKNVTARDLAPLLNQLNDSAGAGSVVHYDPSNVLLMTGRAAVIKRLMEIVERVDNVGNRSVVTVPLVYASAAEVTKMVTELTKDTSKSAMPNWMIANLVADERTNSVLISGEPGARKRIVDIVKQLDRKQEVQGNTRVIYLKYAKAKDLVEVLTGISNSIENEQKKNNSADALHKGVTIKSHEQTNSLILNGAPDVIRDLENVITQLDIRRPQVLVEAIIAEVQDADGLNLGIQWANKQVGVTQFTNTGLPISSVVQANQNSLSDNNQNTAISSFNGIAAGFYQGNWAMLLTALSTNSKNDILATPSIVTLDNMEATFNVGQEVPVLSGSQTTSGDNIFNTVERKTVGIKLKVKPQINEGDSVLMEIEQEVSGIAETATSSTSELGATFNTRTVTNAMLVGSGETVVVGGLLDKTINGSESKVPLLGDIPVLGYLFRSKSEQNSKRNLMLFIRPTIIRERDEFRSVSVDKYRAFNREQIKSRDNKFNDLALSEEQINIPSEQNRGTFLQVKAAIDAFYSQEIP